MKFDRLLAEAEASIADRPLRTTLDDRLIAAQGPGSPSSAAQ
jgi:hypothetical protein